VGTGVDEWYTRFQYNPNPKPKPKRKPNPNHNTNPNPNPICRFEIHVPLIYTIAKGVGKEGEGRGGDGYPVPGRFPEILAP